MTRSLRGNDRIRKGAHDACSENPGRAWRLPARRRACCGATRHIRSAARRLQAADFARAAAGRAAAQFVYLAGFVHWRSDHALFLDARLRQRALGAGTGLAADHSNEVTAMTTTAM